MPTWVPSKAWKRRPPTLIQRLRSRKSKRVRVAKLGVEVEQAATKAPTRPSPRSKS